MYSVDFAFKGVRAQSQFCSASIVVHFLLMISTTYCDISINIDNIELFVNIKFCQSDDK